MRIKNNNQVDIKHEIIFRQELMNNKSLTSYWIIKSFCNNFNRVV